MADFDAIYLAGGSGAASGAVGGALGSEVEEGAAILTAQQDSGLGHSELDGGPLYSNTLQLVPDPIVIRGAGNITV